MVWYGHTVWLKNISVLKIFFDHIELDFARMWRIDEGLTSQNLRYPVYEYVRIPAATNPEWSITTAKFEEFFPNRKSFPNQPIEPKEVRLEIAKRLGKLHSASDIEGVSKTEYREYRKGSWNSIQFSRNTYDTKPHLGKYRVQKRNKNCQSLQFDFFRDPCFGYRK